jgi:hypothetical protein
MTDQKFSQPHRLSLVLASLLFGVTAIQASSHSAPAQPEHAELSTPFTPIDDPLVELRALYGEVRAFEAQGRLLMLYGMPMTPGATPAGAAQQFWLQHGSVFLHTQAELIERWTIRTKEGNKTVIAYSQSIRGVPVEGADATVLVKTINGVPRVVHVAAKLSGEPVLGREQPLIPAELVPHLLQLQQGYGAIRVTGQPERTVLLGEGTRPDAWAWKITVTTSGMSEDGPRTFYFNNATAELLHVRKDWTHSHPPLTERRVGHTRHDGGNEIVGYLTGMATPHGLGPTNNRPHIPGENEPVSTGLPNVRISWSEQGQASWVDSFTDSQPGGSGGTFSLNVGSHTQVDIRSVLGATAAEAGAYFYILDFQGGWHSVCDNFDPNQSICWWCKSKPCDHASVQSALPVAAAEALMLDIPAPGLASLMFAGDDEYTIAQMNVAVHLERARRFVVDRIYTDELTILDDRLVVMVNYCGGDAMSASAFGLAGYYPAIPTNCHYEPGEKGFFFQATRTTDLKRNSAYSSIIAHEYAHYALHDVRPAISFGAFHEGFADAFHHLLNDDDVVGRDARHNPNTGQGVHIRQPLVADCQYPLQMPPNNQPSCRCDFVHQSGQLLSGAWLRILGDESAGTGFRGVYGHAAGLEKARQLFIDWMLITTGTTTNCSTNDKHGASTATLIEVLQADDDDGDLSNGTPHCNLICAAFAAHGITASECAVCSP